MHGCTLNNNTTPFMAYRTTNGKRAKIYYSRQRYMFPREYSSDAILIIRWKRAAKYPAFRLLKSFITDDDLSPGIWVIGDYC